MTTPMPYGWGRVAFGPEDRLPWRIMPFPDEEYEARIARLRGLMARENLDCLLVSGTGAESDSIRYLTNFQDVYGGETVLVVRPDGDPTMVTNAIMHGEPMHSGISDAWPRDVRAAAAPRTVTGNAQAYTLERHVAEAVGPLGGRARVGLSGRSAADLGLRLDLAGNGWEPVAASGLLAEMRTFKSPAEVEVLRTAAHIADAGLDAALAAAIPGATEHDVAAAANEAMFRGGAEHPSFPISVVAGARSGLKHAPPTPKVVEEGDFVYVDLGARYLGYCSDSSRQTVCGEPSSEQLRFMETQIEIVEHVVAGVRPGAVIGELAIGALEIAEREGYAEYLYFRGHGIGLGLGDAPALAPANPATFEAGMVFCLEPMLVKHEFGSASWEDMWHVTETGVERLNRSSNRPWAA